MSLRVSGCHIIKLGLDQASQRHGPSRAPAFWLKRQIWQTHAFKGAWGAGILRSWIKRFAKGRMARTYGLRDCRWFFSVKFEIMIVTAHVIHT